MAGKHIAEANAATIEALHKILEVGVSGNTLMVDAVKGNNTKADTDASIPFNTLIAAKNAATTGTLIIVYPGVYEDYDLLKNGVNWLFMPGSIITIDRAESPIFSDAEGAISCIIDGLLEVNLSYSDPLGENLKNSIIEINNNSDITFRCKSLSVITDANNGVCTIVNNGKLTLNCIKASAHSVLEQGGGFVNFLISAIYSVYAFVIDDGDSTIKIDDAYVSDAIFYNGGDNGYPTSNCILGNSHTGGCVCFYFNTGILYGSAKNVTGLLTSSGPTCKMYITCDNLTSTLGQPSINSDGGELFVKVRNFISAVQFAATSGSLVLECDNAVSSYGDGAGIDNIGINGKLLLKGRFEMTSNKPVISTLSDTLLGTLILDNAKLIVPDTQTLSIEGTKEIVSYNSFSNKAKGENITVNGSLIVASYVE